MSAYYQEESEDSFEDFLEWRRWKREKAKASGGPVRAAAAAPVAHYGAPAAAAAPVRQQQQQRSPAVVARPSTTVVDPRDNTKGKEEAVQAQRSAPESKVAVPSAQEGASSGVSSAGEKWVSELYAANDKKKKELRNEVLAQTRQYLSAGSYETEAGATVELDVSGAESGRTVFKDDHKFSTPPTPYNTTAHFVKADAIETGVFLIEKKGVNPLVVIPADPKNIGGGFPGSSSLEEQFYRRTTALAAVEGDFNYDIPSKGSIYLPNVQVFRDAEPRSGYQLMKAPRKMAFLLASSIVKPKYEPKGRSFVLDSEARALLEAKATAILSAGIEKGHDAIVISAFGCGYNCTPPQCVAAVFRDLLTNKFSNTYKHVTFAIIEDENCMRPHNSNGNLVPFQQEFLTVSKTSGAKAGCCAKAEKKDKAEKKE